MDREFVFQVMSEKEMAFQEEVLNLLNRNDPELAYKMRKRISELEDETRLKIAFVGQHNAGKSTIVSALTKDKSIKISSNVETDSTSSYEWNDVLLYDTPGLYAGVKTTHDQFALEAIKNSDVLIFCITSSLFDDLMIENFVDLAYKRAYKNKIILVVNKMSQEDAPFDELKTNYMSTLTTTLEELGGNINDFPISFIDAKDYKDGIDDEDDELVEISHFEDFIGLLNDQISSRGLLAKIGTKCNILLDSISESIANTGTDLDKNMIIVLNRAARTIRNYKKEMKFELERIEMDLRGEINDIGSELIDKIGVDAISETDQKDTNSKIEKKTEEYISIIEDSLSEKMHEMEEEIENALSSEIGMYVFEGINTEAFRTESVYIRDYSDFVAQYGNASKMIKVGGEKVANLAFVDGAKSITKLTASSGTTLHKVVLNVGHFFGANFKPWQAVKITNKIGKVAKVAGPVMAILDIAVTIGGKIVDEKERKEVKEARESAFNSISSIASDIIAEIDKQYSKMEIEAFDKKIDDINRIKENMTKEAGENSEYIKQLRKYSGKINAFVDTIIQGEV